MDGGQSTVKGTCYGRTPSRRQSDRLRQRTTAQRWKAYVVCRKWTLRSGRVEWRDRDGWRGRASAYGEGCWRVVALHQRRITPPSTRIIQSSANCLNLRLPAEAATASAAAALMR